MSDEPLVGPHYKFYGVWVCPDCGSEVEDPPAPISQCSCGSEDIQLDKTKSTLPISWFDRDELKQMAREYSEDGS